MLYVGGGVIKSDSHEALRELAELAQAPVTTTLMARGAFPDSHPLALGMPGMHGMYAAVAALQEADLIVALGARFDDRVTGQARRLRAEGQGRARGHRPRRDRQEPHARRGDRRRPADGHDRARPRDADSWCSREGPTDTADWVATTAGWKRSYPLRYTQDSDGPLKPQHVVERLSAMTGGDAIVVAGVGQHQMHASQHYAFTKPRSWINSGGAGTMGFAVPAAMGAQIGRPGELVVAIDGDGCFQMTAQELATCAIEGLPIKVLIFNNGFLGMVRQWQELFYDERYSEVHLGTRRSRTTSSSPRPTAAPACAARRRATSTPCWRRRWRSPTCPTVVDFRTHDAEGVFPMVPAGHANDDIVLGPEFSAAEQQAAARKEVIAT